MGKQTMSPHDQAIRSRLLNRLGIYKTIPVSASRSSHPIHSSIDSTRRKHVIRAESKSHQIALSTTNGTRSLIGDVSPYQQPLNDQDRVDLATAQRKTSRIQFSTNVEVVPIPSRHSYSNRIKKFMYSNSTEIRENAERNVREFEFEGWDWHLVLEDDEMYVDSSSGELVHPVWFEDDEQQGTTGDAPMDCEASEASETEYLDVEGPSLSRTQSATMGLDQMDDSSAP
jgi:uncharacterized protein (UPF0333 family)